MSVLDGIPIKNKRNAGKHIGIFTFSSPSGFLRKHRDSKLLVLYALKVSYWLI